MNDAACAGHPEPDIWYPDTKNLYSRETREAQLICESCPVKYECLEFGLREPFGGIYGGVLLAGGRPALHGLPSVPKDLTPAWNRAEAQAAKVVRPVAVVRGAPVVAAVPPRAVPAPVPQPVPAAPPVAPTAPVEPVAAPVMEPVAVQVVEEQVAVVPTEQVAPEPLHSPVDVADIRDVLNIPERVVPVGARVGVVRLLRGIFRV